METGAYYKAMSMKIYDLQKIANSLNEMYVGFNIKFMTHMIYSYSTKTRFV